MLGSVRFKIAMPGEMELGNAGTQPNKGYPGRRVCQWCTGPWLVHTGQGLTHFSLIGHPSHALENPPSLSAGVLVDEPAFYAAGYWVGEFGMFGWVTKGV